MKLTSMFILSWLFTTHQGLVIISKKYLSKKSTAAHVQLLLIDCSSLDRARRFILAKERPFKVLSFKADHRSDESSGRDGSSRFPKAPVQLPHIQEEPKETSAKPFDAQNRLSYSFRDPGGGSLPIQELFKKWLIILRAQADSRKIDKVSGEGPTRTSLPGCKQVEVKTGTPEFLQSAFTLFLRLDASISLPLAVFIPWFLTIRVAHGAEVAKGLAPLWIVGPLLLALYIKTLKGLFSLYAFCFVQSVRLVKNLPDYFRLARIHVGEGRLLLMRLIRPFVDAKAFRMRFRQLEGWLVERYLDFVESIWPYYYRTVQFLKKANFI